MTEISVATQCPSDGHWVASYRVLPDKEKEHVEVETEITPKKEAFARCCSQISRGWNRSHSNPSDPIG